MQRVRMRAQAFRRGWNAPEKTDWLAAAACLAGGLALAPLMARLPLVGWDWYYWFTVPGKIFFYPPWTPILLSPLTALPWRGGFAVLAGITLMTVGVAVMKAAFKFGRASRLGAAALALLSPPALWDMWVGNIEGLVLLGLVAAPPGMILALVKPNLTLWAGLANRQRFGWSAAAGIVSLLVWGWWLPDMFSDNERLFNNIVTTGWGVLGWHVAALGAILLLFSRPDWLNLMAAGFLLSPYLVPNHFLLLLPALGRVRGGRRIVLWLSGWVSVLGIGISAGGWRHLVLGFPLAVWWFTREARA